jgi:fructose-1,6-bisphosphatase I
VSVGTIFAIHQRVSPKGEPGRLEDVLQTGRKMVAAGYVIYGSSTMMVYSTGNGVHGFTLDPSLGEFFLSHPDIKIPKRGSIYSVNEGYTPYWDDNTRRYVWSLKEPGKGPYKSRYIGSMIADVHRTLLYGGIFLYPRTFRKDPVNGECKLRLLYEAAPMAGLVEQAGGIATTGKESILDLVPKGLHDRCPVIMGSPDDVNEYLAYQRGEV